MKLTIAVCTYRRFDWLEKCLENFKRQTLPQKDFKILVIDNSLQQHESRAFKDSLSGFTNLEYIITDKAGLSYARNIALEECSTPYIAYIDDDDMWYPNHLSVLSQALDENPDIGAVYSDLYAVSFIRDEANGKRYPLHKMIQVARDYNRDFMFYYNQTLHVSLMHRKELA